MIVKLDEKLKIWEDKKSKIVRGDLYSDDAESWAKKISQDAQGDGGRDKVNNPAQIRKFYDELLRFRELSNPDPKKFREILPLIYMLKAKCAYARGRNLVSDSFVEMLNQSINAVEDIDDFKAVVTFFEAFMGYHKYYDKKPRGGRT